ncbi:MAG: hypothetical protein MRY79_02130 [Alphaproteobacteria bacterium]|nr:hypothetical protein [Alphaproteobacteria bacterium]
MIKIKKTYLLSFMIFALGSILTLLVHFYAESLRKQEVYKKFIQSAKLYTHVFEKRIETHIHTLESINRFFHSSQFVDENEFRDYVTPLFLEYEDILSIHLVTQTNGDRYIVSYSEPHIHHKNKVGYIVPFIDNDILSFDTAFKPSDLINGNYKASEVFALGFNIKEENKKKSYCVS